jgi:hypothetical protein
MNKTMKSKIILTASAALVSALVLSGCASEETPNGVVSPSPTESSNTASPTPTPSESPLPVDFLTAEAAEILSLIDSEVDSAVLATLKTALARSVAEADANGLVEIASTTEQEFDYTSFLPAKSLKGVGFVLPPEGEPDPDTVMLIDQEFFSLFGIKQVIDLEIYTGVKKSEKGEILLSIDPQTGEDSIKFIYVLTIGEDNIIDSILNVGTYRTNPPVISSKLEYRNDTLAARLFAEKTTGEE